MLSSRKHRAEAKIAALHDESSTRYSLWSEIRNRHVVGGTVAVIVLLLVLLVAAIGPFITGYNPVVASGSPMLPPGSQGHLLGTDNLGFDMLTRVLVGTRSSVFAGIAVTSVAALIGVIVGAAAGFIGGIVDNVLMRITDLFLAFPAAIVAMALSAALGPSLSSSMIGILVVWWPLYARIVRGEVRRVASSSYVEAARLSGARGNKLMRRHIIPAVLPSVAITASSDIGSVIMTVASLSFIGLGTPAPAPELGLMASAGMQYVLSGWWIPIFPGLMVGLMSLLFNYIGDLARNLLRGMES